jgi:hypothetical protein
MLSTPQNLLVVRNYCIAALVVMTMSGMVADSFTSPSRMAQQERLDGYGRYLSAGLVSYAKTWGR